MKALTAMCLGCFFTFSFAQPARIAPRMSGQALVSQFSGPSNAGNLPWDERDFARHQLAQGYLDGVNDTTEGSLWCYNGRWESEERDMDVIGALKKLPPEILKGNAALLVVNFLRDKYPCAGPSTK